MKTVLKISFICIASLCLATVSLANSNKVVVLLSAHETGFWAGEVIDNYVVMSEAGYEIVFATPDGTLGLPNGMYTLDSKQAEIYRQIAPQLANPQVLAELDTDTFAAIYVPGGAGPMFDLYNHPVVNNFIAGMYESNKPVAAVCHGPAALGGVKLKDGSLLIAGKKITAKSNAEENDWARENYPFLLEDQLQKLGATFSAAAPQEPLVIVDGMLITGQNPASTIPLSKKLVELLKK
ncbi:type 1 glutamine amidotransferase domain-containing protein [Marinicella sp. W31]|uniref:type 1 glutamine amidotransferase domain-containing protein n=1 Tax=Marinicella sp. W31 TaxID=3023713 RepID=UPI003756BAA6